jgi:hypothetical protein
MQRAGQPCRSTRVTISRVEPTSEFAADSPLERAGFELPVPGETVFSFAERDQTFEIRLPPPMSELRIHAQYPSPNPVALLPLRSRSFGRQFWK